MEDKRKLLLKLRKELSNYEDKISILENEIEEIGKETREKEKLKESKAVFPNYIDGISENFNHKNIKEIKGLFASEEMLTKQFIFNVWYTMNKKREEKRGRRQNTNNENNK